MPVQNSPVVHSQMLIRKPPADVFEAFVDPEITTKFWFTKSSGRLETGKEVRWEWEMYGVSTIVRVKDVQPTSRILIEWDDPPCPVEWTFRPHGDGTLVQISNWGFQGSDDEVLVQAVDAKGGFTIVLAGLKALLEHNVELNLIADQHPEAVGAKRS